MSFERKRAAPLAAAAAALSPARSAIIDFFKAEKKPDDAIYQDFLILSKKLNQIPEEEKKAISEMITVLERQRNPLPRQALFLAHAYETGLGVKADAGKSLQLYKIAADKSQDAGIFYQFGIKCFNQSGQKEKQTGRAYLEKAAEKKHAEACWELSKIIAEITPPRSNDKMEEDKRLALLRESTKYYDQAVALKHPPALCAEAHRFAGYVIVCDDQNKIQQLDVKIIDCLTQAAEKDYIPAMEILISIYAGMPARIPFNIFDKSYVELEKEKTYMEKLANLEEPEGIYVLGNIYYAQRHIAKKEDEKKEKKIEETAQEKKDEAVKCWKLAAEKGYQPAFFRLADFFAKENASSSLEMEEYWVQSCFFRFAGSLYDSYPVTGFASTYPDHPVARIYYNMLHYHCYSEDRHLGNLQTLLSRCPQDFLKCFSIGIDSPYSRAKSVIYSTMHQMFNASPPMSKEEAIIFKETEKKPETQQIRKKLAFYFLEQKDLLNAMIHIVHFEAKDFSAEERVFIGHHLHSEEYREIAYNYLKSAAEDKNAPPGTRSEAKALLIYAGIEETRELERKRIEEALEKQLKRKATEAELEKELEKQRKVNLNFFSYRDNQSVTFPNKFSDWIKYFSLDEPAYLNLKRLLEDPKISDDPKESINKVNGKHVLFGLASRALKIPRENIPAGAEQKALALPPTYFEFLKQFKEMYAPKKEEKKEKENEAKSPAHSQGLFSAPCILIKTEAEINAANGVIFQQIQTELYQGIAKAGGMELKNDDSVRVFLHDLMELVPSPNSLGFDLEAVEYKSVRTEVLHKIALEVKNKLLSPTYNDRALRTALETIFEILKMNGRCPDGLEAAEAQQKRPG